MRIRHRNTQSLLFFPQFLLHDSWDDLWLRSKARFLDLHFLAGTVHNYAHYRATSTSWRSIFRSAIAHSHKSCNPGPLPDGVIKHAIKRFNIAKEISSRHFLWPDSGITLPSSGYLWNREADCQYKNDKCILLRVTHDSETQYIFNKLQVTFHCVFLPFL